MSGMVLDSVPCGPSESSIVIDAVVTHPRHLRSRWFEDAERVFYTLDLDADAAYADRECERERVKRWLDECRRDRVAYAWLTWLQLRGLEP